MTIFAAFDVYGTLINTSAIARTLAAHGIANPAAFAARWRDKQLEYTFRRALMRRYVPFSECTKSALIFTAAECEAKLSDTARAELLAQYAVLSAFSDAAPALNAISQMPDIRVFAFSNGESAAVQRVLEHNNLADHFADIISADAISTFKPDPAIYAHFLNRADAICENTWLISGNPFDIIGAAAGGWKTAWINRSGTTFDPWREFSPDATISSLTALPPLLAQ